MKPKLLTRLAGTAVIAAVICAAVSNWVNADEETPLAATLVAQNVVQKANPRLKAFMRKKLVATEQIMEGLAMPDYKLIQKGATTMIHMSKEAMWETHGTAVYAQDSADFVRSAERLIKLSNAKDLEGASHTYAQLTIQCVGCHRRARNRRGVAMRQPIGHLAIRD